MTLRETNPVTWQEKEISPITQGYKWFFISAELAPWSRPIIHLVSYGWYVEIARQGTIMESATRCDRMNQRPDFTLDCCLGSGLSRLSPSHSASSSPWSDRRNHYRPSLTPKFQL